VCHVHDMNTVIERACERMIREANLLLGSMDANLDLLGFVVKDVLVGTESELLNFEETLADAIDNALMHAGDAAVDVLKELQEMSPACGQEQQADVVALTARFDQLAERWSALVENVQEVWVLRKPPH